MVVAPFMDYKRISILNCCNLSSGNEAPPLLSLRAHTHTHAPSRPLWTENGGGGASKWAIEDGQTVPRARAVVAGFQQHHRSSSCDNKTRKFIDLNQRLIVLAQPASTTTIYELSDILCRLFLKGISYIACKT